VGDVEKAAQTAFPALLVLSACTLSLHPWVTPGRELRPCCWPLATTTCASDIRKQQGRLYWIADYDASHHPRAASNH